MFRFIETVVMKEFNYWKDRVDAIDDQKHVFKYSVIEGGLIGKKVKSTSFELKFEPATGRGSLCKFCAEFEPIDDNLPTEDITKEIMGGMTHCVKKPKKLPLHLGFTNGLEQSYFYD